MVSKRDAEPKSSFSLKPDFGSLVQRKLGHSAPFLRSERFSGVCRICDFAAKYGVFGLEKVSKSEEKDSMAEREGFEPSIELLTL